MSRGYKLLGQMGSHKHQNNHLLCFLQNFWENGKPICDFI